MPDHTAYPAPLDAPTDGRKLRHDAGVSRTANGTASPGRPLGPHDPSRAPKLQVRKMSWWHERLLDWMMLNPGKTKKEMAQAFGRDYQTIVVITNSEVFKARYEEASGALSQRVMADARERLEGVAEGSLGALAERIYENADKIPTKELRELADMSLRNLGYGPQAGATQVFAPGSQFVSVAPDVLERSRQAILNRAPAAGQSAPAIEHQPQEDLTKDAEPTDGRGEPVPATPAARVQAGRGS